MAKEQKVGSKACTDQRAKFNLPAFTEENRKLGIAVVGNYQCEGRYCYQEGCPIFVKTDDLRYSQACLDHREKLDAPKYSVKELKEMNLNCKTRFCYDKGCPIFVEPKAPEFYCDICKVTVVGDVSDSLHNAIATHNKTKFHQVKLNSAGINLKVYKEIDEDDEPKKKGKKEEKEDVEGALRHFINLQSRVLSKLAWHPEIYEALDSLSSYEILERLCGKSVMEAVPPQMGGKMELKASPKTKKMFEALEKKFEKEDEAKGRPPPRNFNDEDDDEPFAQFTGDGYTMEWVDDEPKKKKEGKKKNGEKKN